MKLKLGTRGSALALAQSGMIARALEEHGAEVELVRIRTEGDADTTRPFAEVGAPGVFVRTLEHELLEGSVDLAVHSFKDLPSASPEGLVIAAAPERANPRDRLLIRPEAFDADAQDLPLRQGASVGTAAARREALLRALRPDLQPTFLRGNVDTRLARLEAGDFDAVLLAGAGLDRLAAASGPTPSAALISIDLAPTVFVPAPSQGAVACQVRNGDDEIRALVGRIDHAPTRLAVEIERLLLARVEAGCDAPFGAYACAYGPEGAEHTLHAVLEIDGALRRACETGTDAEGIVEGAYDALFGGTSA